MHEDVIEVVAVKTESEASKNRPLADTVAEGEAARDFTAKSVVAELVNIHEHNEPEEDGVELEEHLFKEDGKLANIEGFTFIHTSSKHVRPIPHEIADCFYDTRVVGELEIMEAWDYQNKPAAQAAGADPF